MKKIILILTLIGLLMSCQQNKKTFYYDSGELKYDLVLTNNEQKIYYCHAYYKNGNLKEEGQTNRNGLHINHWKVYYSDGVLKWEGNFSSDGQLIISENDKWPDFVHKTAKLGIQGSPKTLKLGHTYKFRLYMVSIHPSMYIVVNQYFKEIKMSSNDHDNYPYSITTDKIGNFYIIVVFPNKDGVYLVGNPSLVFKLNVVK